MAQRPLQYPSQKPELTALRRDGKPQPLSSTIEALSAKESEPAQSTKKPDMIEVIIDGRTYLQMAPIEPEEDRTPSPGD